MLIVKVIRKIPDVQSINFQLSSNLFIKTKPNFSLIRFDNYAHVTQFSHVCKIIQHLIARPLTKSIRILETTK